MSSYASSTTSKQKQFEQNYHYHHNLSMKPKATNVRIPSLSSSLTAEEATRNTGAHPFTKFSSDSFSQWSTWEWVIIIVFPILLGLWCWVLKCRRNMENTRMNNFWLWCDSLTDGDRKSMVTLPVSSDDSDSGSSSNGASNMVGVHIRHSYTGGIHGHFEFDYSDSDGNDKGDDCENGGSERNGNDNDDDCENGGSERRR